MNAEGVERRLAAILAADVVGYSRLMGVDEAGTLAQLKANRREIIDPKIEENNGRVVKLMGDGQLCEFPSAVDAVRCAVEVQATLVRRNAGVPDEQKVQYRVGVNLGDVIVEDGDIYGDGVNVATRLEQSAEPGGVAISGSVYDLVHDKLDFVYIDDGEREMKNIAEPVRVYRAYGLESAPSGKAARRRKPPPTANRHQPLITSAVAALTAILIAGAAVIWLSPWSWKKDNPSTGTPAVTPTEQSTSTTAAKPETDAKPAIAVLPFDNMSGDPDQEYFSDGMTEDLITELSRFSGLLVIARNSVFTYKGTPVKVQQVAKELGVTFVLEGSVRKAGNRVRINAQLIDAHTGHHLWAERYDREMTDVFAVQDEVTDQIITALAITLTENEVEQAKRTAETNPEAYDALLRGVEHFRRFAADENNEARTWFLRAIEFDPNYTRAYANVALTHAMDVTFNWSEDLEKSNELGFKYAEEALALDDGVRQVHFTLGALYIAAKLPEQALKSARRSLEIDPNYADGYGQLANALVHAGRPAECIEAIRKAMRLDPRVPFFYTWILGHALLLQGKFEESAAELQKVVESTPHFGEGHLYYASALGHLGRLDDAEWEIEEAQTLLPAFSLAEAKKFMPYVRQQDLDLFLEGLRKAGMTE